ncbi:MAG: hypothetical protein C0593_02120 [Marinilabiliales bacterium]|nr:MAG: hypothetical protein C0593_02120 [Marinilabiliales bacterium]
MNDQDKTREELLAELSDMRHKYEKLVTRHKNDLKDTEILINTIINNLPSSVFIKDNNFRKTLANNAHLLRMKAHLKSIGLDSSVDILGKTDFEVTTKKQSNEYYTDDYAVIKKGEKIIEKEENGYDPDGKKITIIITKVPLYNHLGEIIGMVGITTDISELRQKGDEIINKNKQLLKLNAEKDKFFSIIAHDLKSPFNSINGYSELLMESVALNDLENIKEYAEIILKSSTRAVDLLMNLVNWAQSETGRIKFTPKNFYLDEAVKDVVLLFEDIAGQKALKIVNNINDHREVNGDLPMISTVLRNLLSNAIKYSHPGGEITISSKHIQDDIQVSIADCGVGIKKDQLKKLLRIDEAHSTNGTFNEKGTGLGLILCKEFIEKHHKKIWVESDEGKGSVFHFTISSVLI